LSRRVEIDPIAFGRGKSTLNSQAQRDLDEVANRLQNFPNYYLIVIGNARSDGDIDVALQLAQERGAAATSYLKKAGVNETRIKSITSRPSGSSGDAQSVTFVVGQLPY
jgi:outer membrane protein OmpA-like peptidoglycan-associated protein